MLIIQFLLTIILFVVAGFAALRLFSIMIASGGLLDIVFGWQKMLARLYASPKRWKNLLGKALGDCEICTAFWFQPAWFCAFWFFCRHVVGYFPTDASDNILVKAGLVFITFVTFQSIGAMGGMFTLMRAKMKAKNGLRMQQQ